LLVFLFVPTGKKIIARFRGQAKVPRLEYLRHEDTDLTGAVVGVAVTLAWDPAAGIVSGGLVGPLVGMAVGTADAAGDEAEPAGLDAADPDAGLP